MKISELFKNNKCVFSFEVFPPKVDSSFESVKTATEEIASLHPAFMSVTYGAGGGTSKYTLDIAQNIKERYDVSTLAHLTCVSSTKETVKEKIAQLTLQLSRIDGHLMAGGNVLDEPTTGLHGADVRRIMALLESIVDKGNTVIVIEHNTDVMKQADYIIDIGPDGGSAGGQVVFTGTVRQMLENSDGITAEFLRKDG